MKTLYFWVLEGRKINAKKWLFFDHYTNKDEAIYMAKKYAFFKKGFEFKVSRKKETDINWEESYFR